MVDAVKANNAYHDKVDRDDVVQQARYDQDQNAGDESDYRRDMIGGEKHFKSPG
jgi:hypothetical protein